MPLQSRDARLECWADEQHPDGRHEQGKPKAVGRERRRNLRTRRRLSLTLTATLLTVFGAGAFMFPGAVADVLGAADWIRPPAGWTALFPQNSTSVPASEVAPANTEPPVLVKAAAVHPSETGSVGAARINGRDFAWLPEKPADQPALDPAALKLSAIAISPQTTAPSPNPPAAAKAPSAREPIEHAISSKASERAPPDAPTAANPPGGVSASMVAATVETPRAVKAPAASEVAELIQRARYRLGLGDITGARLLLERAASGSDPNALMALAETYDPAILARLGVRGPKGDPAKAREFYERAAASGLPEARTRVLALR